MYLFPGILNDGFYFEPSPTYTVVSVCSFSFLLPAGLQRHRVGQMQSFGAIILNHVPTCRNLGRYATPRKREKIPENLSDGRRLAVLSTAVSYSARVADVRVPFRRECERSCSLLSSSYSFPTGLPSPSYALGESMLRMRHPKL